MVRGEEHEIRPGMVVYVPAREEHRFVDVSEDLSIVVVLRARGAPPAAVSRDTLCCLAGAPPS